MGSGILITGTDTGVGKTFFTCALATLLRSHGYIVGVMKPAETGCEMRDGDLFPADAWRLKRVSACSEPIETICPYRFAEPLAPSIAAERAGVKIDIDRMLAVYREISARHDIILVEGAGGLMVPLVGSFTYADFTRVAKLPLIVVAANKLGVINHLLLTLEHAAAQRLLAFGYVLNRISNETSLAADTNREALFGLTGIRCLTELPFVKTASTEEVALDLSQTEFDLEMIAPALARH